MKYLKWIVKSLLIATLLLYLTNISLRFANINVPINIYTITLVTIFKVPAIIVLIIFYLL